MKIQPISISLPQPERVRGDGYTTASDIWAVGVSIAEVAIGHFPVGAADQRGGKNDELFGLCVIIAENRSAVIVCPVFFLLTRSVIRN